MDFLRGIDTSKYGLLNVIYHERDDALDIILKENDTNNKKLITIASPLAEYWVVNEEYRDYDYNKIFIEMDKCTRYTTPYKRLAFDIPLKLGGDHVKSLDRLKGNMNFHAVRDHMKNITTSPYLFGTDFDIENFYRIKYRLQYETLAPRRLTKAYLDIEVDGKGYPGIPTDGVCPINVMTIVDEESMNAFTYILRNDNISEISKLEKDSKKFIKDCSKAFDESYGEIKYNLYFFDDELSLLKEVFRRLNKLNRDFILVWNIAYDLPYIIGRIKELGGSPEDIMCHPDFQIKEAWFSEDTRNKSIPSKSHRYKISMYSVWLCQMIIYAGLRKSGSEIPSYSLNSVAKSELGDEKLDYSEEADIKMFPYLNFLKFLLYNIKDTLLQKGVENKTNDLDSLYSRSIINSTDYLKAFKQTVFLKHRLAEEYFRQGIIPGNNVNILIERDENSDVEFAGALVADPLLNNANGVYVMGERSRFIFKFVADYDFSAMYPNIIVSNNISPHTMYGKIVIDRVINTHYNKYDIEHEQYDAGKEFLDNYTSEDIIAFGNKWLNLPTTEDLINIVKRETDEYLLDSFDFLLFEHEVLK